MDEAKRCKNQQGTLLNPFDLFLLRSLSYLSLVNKVFQRNSGSFRKLPKDMLLGQVIPWKSYSTTDLSMLHVSHRNCVSNWPSKNHRLFSKAKLEDRPTLRSCGAAILVCTAGRHWHWTSPNKQTTKQTSISWHLNTRADHIAIGHWNHVGKTSRSLPEKRSSI